MKVVQCTCMQNVSAALSVLYTQPPHSTSTKLWTAEWLTDTPHGQDVQQGIQTSQVTPTSPSITKHSIYTLDAARLAPIKSLFPP